MRKSAFSSRENKGVDPLCCNHTAHRKNKKTVCHASEIFKDKFHQIWFIGHMNTAYRNLC